MNDMELLLCKYGRRLSVSQIESIRQKVIDKFYEDTAIVEFFNIFSDIATDIAQKREHGIMHEKITAKSGNSTAVIGENYSSVSHLDYNTEY